MESVLAGLAQDTSLVYIVTLTSAGMEFKEHLHNLRKVFDRLQEANLRLKPTKCHLAHQVVEYLGYIVSEKGIAADPRKYISSPDLSSSQHFKCLCSFLGLATTGSSLLYAS